MQKPGIATALSLYKYICMYMTNETKTRIKTQETNSKCVTKKDHRKQQENKQYTTNKQTTQPQNTKHIDALRNDRKQEAYTNKLDNV